MQKKTQQLAQENQALKLDSQNEQMKIATDAQSDAQRAELKKQQQTDEYNLKKEAQDREAQLAHAKALDEYNLKCECAERDHKLACDMQEKKNALEKDRLSFEQAAHSDEQTAKATEQARVKAESDAVSIMPKLENAFSGMQQTLDKILEVLMNPRSRSISIANIHKQRGADGELTSLGATVKPTLQ